MSEEVTTTVLLKINSVDFTSSVNKRVYSVQRQDEYAKWIDGNWNQHRDIARTRASGTIVLLFKSQAEFETFKTAVAAVKTNGGYLANIQLWVNNTKQLETVDAFLDFSTKHVWTEPAYGTAPELATVTVKITER